MQFYYVHTYTRLFSQYATIIKISQLNDRLRASNDSCKNSRRSFRASSAVHSKSSQRKGSSCSTRRSRPPPAPIACHYFSRELHFRVGAPLYPGSQWNQCSFTAHHAPSIIRRTPFRFRLGHHHQPSATIATTADAHPLRVLHFTPDSSFTFYTRSHCALAIPQRSHRGPLLFGASIRDVKLTSKFVRKNISRHFSAFEIFLCYVIRVFQSAQHFKTSKIAKSSCLT